MKPEDYLSKLIRIYHTALKDLQDGNAVYKHVPKIELMLHELDEMIHDVKSNGGKTKGYTAIKNELMDLHEKIKLAVVQVPKEITV